MYHFCAQTVGSLPVFPYRDGGRYEHESNPKSSCSERQTWLDENNSNAKGSFGLLSSVRFKEHFSGLGSLALCMALLGA